MIQRVFKKQKMHDLSLLRADLQYWLSQPPWARIEAVEFIRKQWDADANLKDFRELLVLFNLQHVEYLMVGGYALAYHGAPRFTGDMDLFIQSTPENIERVLAALRDFGFGSLGLSVEDFQNPNTIIQLGVPPARVGLLTSIDGVSWDEAWQGKDEGHYGGITVFFLGRAEFIANKKASGRHKDLADIEAIEDK